MISGYYGFDNCGDEAVLMAIIHCLKQLKPDIRIVVLSGNPKKTRKLYDVKAVNRWNPLKVALELLSCRLMLSGGGSLLQDVTSAKSPRYYLAIINLATILRKRVMIYCQGIGPLTIEKNRRKTSKAVNRCHLITVRDMRSEELLRELGVTCDIRVTCDPVLALTPEYVSSSEIVEDLRKMGIPDNAEEKRRPLLMVTIRSWRDDRHISPVSAFLDMQLKRGWNVLLVPAQYTSDIDPLKKVAESMTVQPFILDKCLTAREFFALTVHSDMVFSMRLHGLVCAFAAGIPMLGLSYDPKVEAFMEQAGSSRYCLPFDGFDSNAAERLQAELENIPLPTWKNQEARCLELRRLAWETAEKAVGLL